MNRWYDTCELLRGLIVDYSIKSIQSAKLKYERYYPDHQAAELSGFGLANSWNMEYFLGTYAPLKWYAQKFFEKYSAQELATLYKSVYENWQKAFEMKKNPDLSVEENRRGGTELLKQAEAWERQAVDGM